jgi:hypothetical protein
MNARKYGAERVFYTAFYLAHKFAGAQIPMDVLTKLRGACPRILIWWLEKQTGLLQFPKPAFSTWQRLWLIGQWRSKAYYLGSFLFRILFCKVSVLVPFREDLSSVYNLTSDSCLTYLKYFLIHQRYIWSKALTKRINLITCFIHKFKNYWLDPLSKAVKDQRPIKSCREGKH